MAFAVPEHHSADVASRGFSPYFYRRRPSPPIETLFV
jgi:hypothetical protein